MRPCLLALLLTGVLQSSAPAQDKSDTSVRLLYSPKGLAAADLTSILEKHYEGLSTVKFLAEKQSNLISIRATNQGALDDVLKTLSALDKTPRSIAFQGLVIDAVPPAEGAAAAEFDQTQLTGSAEAVLKVARDWVKEGKARVRRFNWTGLENQVSEATVGELVPRITGMTTTTRGQFPHYNDTSVGTLFSVKPRITETNEIIVELIYNHSEIDAKAAPEIKADGGFVPSRILQGRSQTSVNIPTGRSVVISAREAGATGPASVVVLSAAIVNPNATPPAAAAAPPAAPPTNPPATPPGVTAFRGEVFSSAGTSSSSSSSLLLSQYRSDQFAKAIKLTDEQKNKLEELSAERDKLTTEMSNAMRERRVNNGDAETRLTEITAFSTKRRELDDRAVNLLTPDQKKYFDNFAEEYRRTSRERVRAASPDPAAGPTVTFTGRPNSIESMNRALERSPNDPRYLGSRAQIYAADEKWDAAIADYRKVLEVEPRSLLAVTELAAVLAARGDEAGYRQFAEQLLERFGNEASPTEKLRVADACLLRPEWLPNAAAAESMLEAAIKAIPPEGTPQPRARIDLANAAGLPFSNISSSTAQDLLVAKARLHILRGQPDEAIMLLKSFLDEAQAVGRRSRPDLEVSAWCSLAIAQLSKGDKESAQSSITRARSIQSEGPWPRVFSSAFATFELTSKVLLQRAEQILSEAGVKPAGK